MELLAFLLFTCLRYGYFLRIWCCGDSIFVKNLFPVYQFENGAINSY